MVCYKLPTSQHALTYPFITRGVSLLSTRTPATIYANKLDSLRPFSRSNFLNPTRNPAASPSPPPPSPIGAGLNALPNTPHTSVVATVTGTATAQNRQNSLETDQTPFSPSKSKNDVLKMAHTNVAGRKVSVTKATVRIAAPSACAARPISTETRASCCAMALKASWISF